MPPLSDERRVWTDSNGLVHIIKPRVAAYMNSNELFVATWHYLCGGKTLSGHAQIRARDCDAIPSCLACIGAHEQ